MEAREEYHILWSKWCQCILSIVWVFHQKNRVARTGLPSRSLRIRG